ncbi:helix-turn-helix domain-containing protein [Streptomyces sp. ACA25]|uniref:ArsR/SmtB family transcription factor n=1 Tax=Streptomyces sp. ACA25 TaxID=3022596 RepID=UPI002307FD41|nr:helix-turn-helix domain-containing protein [Streptomyces sp. ACA25]MDB1088628.1 helix-turn-helix domain-containing protein [Streptomyces sp. ACA25]
MTEEPTRVTDLEALKVFTHPLRIKLYRQLYAAQGPATASQLADRVDEAVSLVSYHLRKMAAHGFIEEAAGHSSDGRERWWRVAGNGGWSVRASDFTGTPEGAAVVGQLTRQVLAARMEQYQAYLDQQHSWGKEWSDAALSIDHQPRLTAAELQRMGEELQAVLLRWTEHGRAADEAGDREGREFTPVQLYAYPVRP